MTHHQPARRARWTWLARIEGRASRSAIWPALSPPEAADLAARLRADYTRLFDALTEERLAEPVSYTNSAGQAFTTPLGDILLHVVLHAQYHRGKVNVLLRQGGQAPVPADFITFVRGAPAAGQGPPSS